MSNISALRRAVVVTAASALAVSAIMVSGATSAVAAVTPKTGGILTFLEHTPRLDHYDPSRIYTGRDLAFMNSFMTRTLVAYNPVPGAAGANLVADLATNTGVPSNAERHGSSHFAQVQLLKMEKQSHVQMFNTVSHVFSQLM